MKKQPIHIKYPRIKTMLWMHSAMSNNATTFFQLKI